LRQEDGETGAGARRTLADLGMEKSRIRTIIESLPNGLVVTNTEGQVVLTNPTFCQLIGLAPGSCTGGPFTDYITDEGLCKLVQDISRGRYVDFEDIPTYEFVLVGGQIFSSQGTPCPGRAHGMSRGGYLLPGYFRHESPRPS
jgi:two-component system phosphate regulon sensor histidine kinase PhoR